MPSKVDEYEKNSHTFSARITDANNRVIVSDVTISNEGVAKLILSNEIDSIERKMAKRRREINRLLLDEEEDRKCLQRLQHAINVI